MSPADYFSALYPPLHFAAERGQWLNTTRPDLSAIGFDGMREALDLARFAALHRATIILLTVQAYRVEHGELPKSLFDVLGKSIDRLPLDPYSSLEFRYFPKGLAAPNEVEAANAQFTRTNWMPLMPGMPGIWCTGPDLGAGIYHNQNIDGPIEPTGEVTYYWLRNGNYTTPILSTYEVLEHGFWFPIPDPPHDEPPDDPSERSDIHVP